MRFEENQYFSPSQLDFVPRERRSQAARLVIAFTFAIAFVFMVGYVPGIADRGLAPLLSALIVAVLCFYVMIRHQKSLDLVMTTEHQNLLFSQSLVLGSNFVLIVRRDGTIVYTGQGLRDLLPNADFREARALEVLFAQSGVSPADRERVMGSIFNNVADRLVFPIVAGGEQKEYVLTIEPIQRPAGFLLIRGREYRGERAGLQLMPDMLRSTSADKLDHLLANTRVAHYATDAFGRFEYVNQAFEDTLGYTSGEVLSSRITLPVILYQLGLTTIADDYTLSDHNGEAVIEQKSGDLVSCLIYQNVIRDEKGKAIGVTGSILTSAMLGQ